MNRDLNNLASKKLVTTGAAIITIATLAKDAPDKLPYCIIIAVIAVIYKICQAILDWKGK